MLLMVMILIKAVVEILSSGFYVGITLTHAAGGLSRLLCLPALLRDSCFQETETF